MKNFFHLTVSVILGSLLGYGLYFKILNKPTAAKAEEIAVDELFFADNAAFEKKQHEQVATTRPTYADTLQVNPEFFATTAPPVRNVVATAKNSEVKSINTIANVRPIEVVRISKPTTIDIPVTRIATPEKTEVAYSQVEANLQEIPATIATENEANTQQEEKKKKFLFFSRKEKNN